MDYRKKVLTELRKAKSGGYLVAIYRWEDLEACLVARVIRVSDLHVQLLEISPEAEWDKEPTTVPITKVYELDVGTRYLDRLTQVTQPGVKLSMPSKTTRFMSVSRKRSALMQACEAREVATVSLQGVKDDVIVYGVGEDYFEFSVIEENGEVVSGSFFVPLRLVKWVQVGSRRQEIVQLTCKMPEREKWDTS